MATNYQSKYKEYREKAKEIVSKMTLEEKVFQTVHSASAIPRLNIKAYNWWNEALHGVARAGTATVFPQAIGLSATFDEELIQEVADAIATEGRAKYNMQQKYGDLDIYKGLTFWAPNVNIFRDPRWGRGHETLGEDPYLSGRLGVRFIKGMQGDDENHMKVAACAKHFAVHSGPEDIRHSFNAVITKQDLYETYLPAFKACVQEGEVESVMGAYNRMNGEPCCGSKTLLKDILRDEWGFTGHVVSDCWAIKDFHEHHKVVKTPEESVSMAMNNGCDLNCGSLFLYLQKAVNEGKVSMERLDEAVVNLFTARMKLGILEPSTNTVYSTIGYEKVDSIEHRELNLKAAQKSIVLLKNKDNLLPLNKEKIKTIGIIGPNANNRKSLIGNYEGTASRYITIAEGIQDYVGDDVRVYYSEACHLFQGRVGGLAIENDRVSEVKGVCEKSDVIIACMGLDSGLEGEEGDIGNEFASGDKPNLNLPGRQQDILKAVYESGKPVVLILLSGSALAIPWAEENIPAILQGWYPGAQGGKAIASILFGESSPEGKLPITFYRTTEELPEFTDYSMENRTYRYMKNNALYPFGYGLSYTSFQLDNIDISRDTIEKNSEIKISVDVTNTGNYKSAETLQLYVKIQTEGSPNPQLKAFQKVNLDIGETKKVELALNAESFGLYDENGKLILHRGEAEIYIGTSQPDERSVELTGQRPYCKKVKIETEEVL